jgi:hypothetical protein
MPNVLNFLPSTCGFRFNNHFPPGTPHRTISFMDKTITIGDASKGMCGGMVYAVRDFFEQGLPIPAMTKAPASGKLFDFICRRLYDSFNLPTGPLKYMRFMNPLLPDGESYLGRLGVSGRSRSWRMIAEEWPKIKKTIDDNRLSTIGLVQVKSANPMDLGQNHQVLVYGYDLNGDDLTLRIYDPNYACNDNVTISLNISDPGQAVTVSRHPAGSPLYFFFETNYCQCVPEEGLLEG